MNLSAEPQDTHLVEELLRLAHRREIESRNAFESAKGKGMLEFMSMYRNVGLDLRVFLTALPDRDLMFAFALWKAGHGAFPEQPDFPDSGFTEYEGWRQDAINTIAGSVDLVRYITDGAKRLIIATPYVESESSKKEVRRLEKEINLYLPGDSTGHFPDRFR